VILKFTEKEGQKSKEQTCLAHHFWFTRKSGIEKYTIDFGQILIDIIGQKKFNDIDSQSIAHLNLALSKYNDQILKMHKTEFDRALTETLQSIMEKI
jgi:hypothetical protein